MTITVTQEHINTGVKQACGLCPIAKAMKETGRKWVLVGEDFVEWQLPDGTGRRYMLPLEAQDFIKRFDNGDLVKPFSFRIPD